VEYRRHGDRGGWRRIGDRRRGRKPSRGQVSGVAVGWEVGWMVDEANGARGVLFIDDRRRPCGCGLRRSYSGRQGRSEAVGRYGTGSRGMMEFSRGFGVDGNEPFDLIHDEVCIRARRRHPSPATARRGPVAWAVRPTWRGRGGGAAWRRIRWRRAAGGVKMAGGGRTDLLGRRG
jgi:hypothetical protein